MCSVILFPSPIYNYKRNGEEFDYHIDSFMSIHFLAQQHIRVSVKDRAGERVNVLCDLVKWNKWSGNYWLFTSSCSWKHNHRLPLDNWKCWKDKLLSWKTSSCKKQLILPSANRGISHQSLSFAPSIHWEFIWKSFCGIFRQTERYLNSRWILITYLEA